MKYTCELATSKVFKKTNILMTKKNIRKLLSDKSVSYEFIKSFFTEIVERRKKLYDRMDSYYEKYIDSDYDDLISSEKCDDLENEINSLEEYFDCKIEITSTNEENFLIDFASYRPRNFTAICKYKNVLYTLDVVLASEERCSPIYKLVIHTGDINWPRSINIRDALVNEVPGVVVLRVALVFITWYVNERFSCDCDEYAFKDGEINTIFKQKINNDTAYGGGGMWYLTETNDLYKAFGIEDLIRKPRKAPEWVDYNWSYDGDYYDDEDEILDPICADIDEDDVDTDHIEADISDWCDDGYYDKMYEDEFGPDPTDPDNWVED